MSRTVMNRATLLYYAAIGWTITMFIGCSLPGEELPDMSGGRDKWLHIIIFVGFGLLWRLTGRSAWWVIIAGTLYGILIEIWQALMPLGRSGDVYDAIGDTVGTLIGVLLAWGVKKVINV
jgi:VanZ family protein